MEIAVFEYTLVLPLPPATLFHGLFHLFHFLKHYIRCGGESTSLAL
jgi:hypothetical protein